MEWSRLLLVFLGGGVGSSARYLVTLLVGVRPAGSLPTATLAVNIVGCFLIELLMMGVVAGRVSAEARLLLATGVLGGFTTYSAFTSESLALLRSGSVGMAALYVSLTLSGGLVAGLLGAILGRSLFAAVRG